MQLKKYQINAKKWDIKTPPTFVVDEADIETIDYNNDSDDDMFAKESIVNAANKIFDKYKNNLDKAETINCWWYRSCRCQRKQKCENSC